MEDPSIAIYGSVKHLLPQPNGFDPVGIFARDLTPEQLTEIKDKYYDGTISPNGGSPLIIYQLKGTLGSSTGVYVTHIRLLKGLVTFMPYFISMQEYQEGTVILRRNPTREEIESALGQVRAISEEIDQTKQMVPTLGEIEKMLQTHLRSLATDNLEGRVRQFK